ncbi:hypothetical protein [Sanguibacter suaedae]|uniref:FtsX-like permease family protein n=1 Tax=Sanguibacter suaedae TaxID=2795737 RepID=A0A934I7U2_9MICO|nr:hypothetical protein [Sanguibacter suaedae]MBI9113587.1 hypothetical protein [Sanguibacter suaedae]
MGVALRLATRLAFGRDAERRWRQVCVVLATALATALVCLSVALVAVSWRVEETLAARTPDVAQDDEGSAYLVPRGFVKDGRDVSVLWIEPVAGHEGESRIVPPGLEALPAPGEAVVSPGLLRLGLGPEVLGFDRSDVGQGVGGTIGPEGVGTQDELLVWAVPAEGRTLDRVGIPLRIDGFPSAPTLEAEDDRFDVSAPQSPIPRPPEMRMLTVFLVVLPTLVMTWLAARARSAVRAGRSEDLLRHGVSPRIVRTILALEGALLALVGSGLGALVSVLVSPVLTTIPLSGSRFLPGDLSVDPGTALWVVLGVVVLAASSSSTIPLAVSRRSRPPGRVSAWRLLPVGAGLTLVVVPDLLGTTATQVFYGGAVMLAVGLTWSVPYLAQLVALRRRSREGGHRWLAAARVVHAPRTASRVAALLSLAIYLGAVSVSIYVGPGSGVSSHERSADGPAVYVVDWHDGRPDDVARLTEGLEPLPGAVVLPLAPAGEDGVPTVMVRSCSDLEVFGPLLVVAPCTADGEVSGEALDLFRTMLHMGISSAGSLDPGGDPAEALDGALVLSSGPVSQDQLYVLGGELPAFNTYDVLSEAQPRNPLSSWIGSAWLISIIIIGLAVVREMAEHSREVRHDARALIPIGLSEDEARRVGSWTLLLPILAAAPVSYVCGLVTSLFGTGVSATSYAPLWITVYTAVIVAATLMASRAGSRPSGT